jgi:hypothetical protein
MTSFAAEQALDGHRLLSPAIATAEHGSHAVGQPGYLIAEHQQAA